MVMFIIGCFMGTFFGVAIMCLIQCNSLKAPGELKEEVIRLNEADHSHNPSRLNNPSANQNWERLF